MSNYVVVSDSGRVPINTFDFEGKVTRVLIRDGDPWWVLKDVCDVLGLENVTMTADRLDDDEKSELSLPEVSSNGVTQNRRRIIINESGLNRTIFRSDKPEALKYQKWVFSEVLPTIRKMGKYEVKPKTTEEFLLEAVAHLQAIKAQNAALEQQIEEDKPKVEFFNAVTDSKDAISIGDVAKVLNFPGVGRNNLFEFLRQQKVLLPNNSPYQKYIDRGYFRVIEQKYMTPTGETRISLKTLVYQSGMDFIRKLLSKQADEIPLDHFDDLIYEAELFRPIR